MRKEIIILGGIWNRDLFFLIKIFRWFLFLEKLFYLLKCNYFLKIKIKVYLEKKYVFKKFIIKKESRYVYIFN